MEARTRGEAQIPEFVNGDFLAIWTVIFRFSKFQDNEVLLSNGEKVEQSTDRLVFHCPLARPTQARDGRPHS
jgi:hypothetical protein